MTDIIYIGPNENVPPYHHIAVVVHKDQNGLQKGYFYDSTKRDFGGSGPFDFHMNEAIERAQKYAAELGVATVVVRAKRE
ncbi:MULTISPECIES: hypothetical protein [Asaia]|uniref:hypothetical protein n=1 Tax=Asaia TaxID=91914 RepID=UPI002FC2E083